MKICVGVIGEAIGWRLLLDQEGIPNVEAGTTFSPEEFSAIVVSAPVGPEMAAAIRTYLAGGGALLCSGEVYREVTDRPTTAKYISYLLPEENSPLARAGFIDLETECELPGSASILRTGEGKAAVAMTTYESGHVIALPFDCARLVADHRVRKKSFYADRGRLPFERVSQVSRSGIRKVVVRALELLHHRRGLPYAHIWYYPDGGKSLFNFRIDTDEASENEILSLAELLKKHSIPATWFIHVRAQERFLATLKSMTRQEIAVHCYEHRVYDDTESNARNIRKAIDILQSEGITPMGFAAPYGTWNASMAAAIESFNLEYSSEFAYDYDNFPSWPIIGGQFTKTLQIPVHPISIGNLRRQSFSRREMIDYLNGVLNQKLNLRDPLFFYHHPKNGHHGVLEELFASVKRADISSLTMREFSQWWKRRNRNRIEIGHEASTLKITSSAADPDLRLHLTRQDGAETFAPIRSSIDLDALPWEKIPEPVILPPDIERMRRFNPWIPINAVEDGISALLKGKGR